MKLAIREAGWCWLERDPSCRTFQKTGLAHIVSTAHAAEIEGQLVVPDEEST